MVLIIIQDCTTSTNSLNRDRKLAHPKGKFQQYPHKLCKICVHCQIESVVTTVFFLVKYEQVNSNSQESLFLLTVIRA